MWGPHPRFNNKMDEEILDTNNFFKSRQLPLSDLWLESCINWFRDQQSGATYSAQQLCTSVYEQWLLLDLRDVQVPQLKPNELKAKKTIINRTLILQVMSVVDISKPKLYQLQKIRAPKTLISNDIDENESHATGSDGNYANKNGKRMLQLTLTDGINEVKAIEYKAIPVLNENITPGTKIRIIPPVTLRRGQLMLEQHNVKLLGGEVEEIFVSHATENVLARALNLSENPNPRIVHQPNINLNDSLLNTSPVANVARTSGNNRTVQQSITNYTSNDHYGTSEISPEEEEELRIAAEIDTMIEAEMDVSDAITKRKSPSLITFQNHNSCDNTKRARQDPNALMEQDKEEDEEDIFSSFNIDQHLDKIEEQMREMSQENPLTIAALIEKRKNGVEGKFRVHAEFKSVAQKLTLKEMWILQILIGDETGELVVFVHSDVITDLIGYSIETIKALKKDLAAKNSAATRTMMQALDGLKEKLIRLNCLMQIEIRSDVNDGIPTITGLP